MKNIEQLIEEFDHGKDYPSKITKAARNYISNKAKSYGWDDKEFVNGFQCIKWIKVTVMLDNSIQTIWNFKTVQEAWGGQCNGKIGYIVDSWRDHFNVQTSKEDGNTAYVMIMQKAKEVNGAKVIVETLI